MSAVRTVETAFSASIGLVAAYKARPINEDLALRWRLFRKPWMRLPVPVAAFGMAYYVGSQIPAKLFHKWSGNDSRISFDHYAGQNDLVGKFRVFENDNIRDDKKDVIRRLAAYCEDPYTKPELIQKLAEYDESDELSKFRVKRVGVDADPIFWTYGKIHGLENIAFVDPKKLAECEGNPVAIQRLINEVEDVARYNSHEEMLAKLEQAMIEYKERIGKMNLASSDSKKLLALPFYLAKRAQLPEPKRGQLEWDLYREIYGEDYLNDLDLLSRDNEEKITEFNYEKFFP